MAIYQRGTSWMVTVGSGENRYRKSFKTYEKALMAEREQLAIRDQHLDAQEGVKLPTSPVTKGGNLGKTLLDAYHLAKKDRWSQSRSDSSIKNANIVLEHLGRDTLLRSISTETVRELIDELDDLGNTGATINKKLSALSVMLKEAADEGWLNTIPRIKRRKEVGGRIRWMDAEEELKALGTCERFGLFPLRDFIVACIDTGFRKMELLNFKVRDYHHGMLHLYADETKTAKPRSIPATDRVAEIINRRSNNDRLFDDLTPSKLRDQWEFLREQMGMLDDTQFVIHMLRHTCATRMVMVDKTAEFIQEWMGHATPLTTAKYIHMAPKKLLEGKEALDRYRETYKPMLKVA